MPLRGDRGRSPPGLLASEDDAGVLVEYVEEAEREKPRRTMESDAVVGIHE